MKTYSSLLLATILLGLSQTSWAACDQTLNPGANVASAVSSAANGATICLNTGNYGTVNFNGINRSGFVTLQSASGQGAEMSPRLSGSKFIQFKNMTLSSMQIIACSSNIQVLQNTWRQNTSGIAMVDHGYNCATNNKQILIDGNKFINTAPAWSEGKLGIVSVNGVTISNNIIDGNPSRNGGDGIQTGGNIDNVVISKNIFRNIRQNECESTPGRPHCDAIQFVSNCNTCVINGNWFDNVEVVLQHHDANVPVVFTNNLITNAVQMWAYSTPGSASNSRIEHNTFYNLGLAMWGKTGGGVSDTKGLIGNNNLIVGSTAQPATCNKPSCTFSNNLCQTTGQCGFSSNAKIGLPKFKGGNLANFRNWGDWQLDTNTIGYKAGSDGKDIGINYYGTGSVSPPIVTSSPLETGKNLRITTTGIQ